MDVHATTINPDPSTVSSSATAPPSMEELALEELALDEAAAGLRQTATYLLFGLVAWLSSLALLATLGFMHSLLVVQVVPVVAPILGLVVYLGMRAGLGRLARSGVSAETVVAGRLASGCLLIGAVAAGFELFFGLTIAAVGMVWFPTGSLPWYVYTIEQVSFIVSILALIKICRDMSRVCNRADLVRLASRLYPVLLILWFGWAYTQYSTDALFFRIFRIELLLLAATIRSAAILVLVRLVRRVASAMTERLLLPTAMAR